jgi:hypothetical protein
MVTFPLPDMKLDVNTPLGQDAIKWARRGIKGFLAANPHLSIVETEQSRPADVDALLFTTSTGILKAVVEIKTRYMTLDRLMVDYEGKWLLEHSKLTRGTRLATMLRCDFVAFVILPPNHCVLAQTISDHNANWIPEIEVGEAVTRKTTNDATTSTRKVAYIDMTNARKYPLKTITAATVSPLESL